MKKKYLLIIAVLPALFSACSTISVLDPRTFNPDLMGNRSVIFGSISLIRQKTPQKLNDKYFQEKWFSLTLKNIRTNEYLTLVRLPRNGRYYLALEPGEYAIQEWIAGLEWVTFKCLSRDLFFYIPPRSFTYLGDLVINLEAKGEINYQVKDDFNNASYFFYERFTGFLRDLTKNLIQIRNRDDYYFAIN